MRESRSPGSVRGVLSNGHPYRDKVLNSEGIANRAGPESCVAHREMRGEALTGEPAGQPLDRGKHGRATHVPDTEPGKRVPEA